MFRGSTISRHVLDVTHSEKKHTCTSCEETIKADETHLSLKGERFCNMDCFQVWRQ